MNAAPGSDQLGRQVIWLFVLAVPIACIAWTVTHEEIFKEPRQFCIDRSRRCAQLLERKFFYLFTCEYCFSHWITLLFMLLTGYRLLLENWVGRIIAFFALVFVCNIYMSLYSRLRVDINSGKKDIEVKEKQIEQQVQQIEATAQEMDKVQGK